MLEVSQSISTLDQTTHRCPDCGAPIDIVENVEGPATEFVVRTAGSQLSAS